MPWIPWISSSGTALAAARLGYSRHEAGKLADLLHALGSPSGLQLPIRSRLVAMTGDSTAGTD
jgi:hypothetical protein